MASDQPSVPRISANRLELSTAREDVNMFSHQPLNCENFPHPHSPWTSSSHSRTHPHNHIPLLHSSLANNSLSRNSFLHNSAFPLYNNKQQVIVIILVGNLSVGLNVECRKGTAECPLKHRTAVSILYQGYNRPEKTLSRMCAFTAVFSQQSLPLTRFPSQFISLPASNLRTLFPQSQGFPRVPRKYPVPRENFSLHSLPGSL